jgi:hypothetical protein
MERSHLWSSAGGKVYVYSGKLEQIVGLIDIEIKLLNYISKH